MRIYAPSPSPQSDMQVIPEFRGVLGAVCWWAPYAGFPFGSLLRAAPLPSPPTFFYATPLHRTKFIEAEMRRRRGLGDAGGPNGGGGAGGGGGGGGGGAGVERPGDLELYETPDYLQARVCLCV